MSYGYWMDKHTKHHANPNHDDLDPDVGPGVLVWSPAAARGKGFLTACRIPTAPRTSSASRC
jgi:fatty acid desaturase